MYQRFFPEIKPTESEHSREGIFRSQFGALE
jgi:hypothetical protein